VGLPLEGVEVVEATTRIQGPLAGLLLQMLGAHVVRVEPPGGDPIRLVPPYAGSDGYFFAAFNHGKDVRELNLSTHSGRLELVDLLSGADAFIHNWAPGKAEQWGLTAANVAAGAPRVTYVETSGWGDEDRNRRMLGTEFLVQALSGLASGLTPHGEHAAPSRALLVDCLGAMVACEGALAGLLRAARSGRGAHVRASLMAGAMALQTHVLDALRVGQERTRFQGRPLWHGLDRPLRAADGFVALDLQHPGDCVPLCRALGVETAGPSEQVELQIRDRIQRRRARESEQTLTSAGIACAAVAQDLAGVALDPRFAMLFDEEAGGCRVAATPWRFAA
jgi:crotonobetainyl-CoA:carnitine CoA-transferase CaiB-like acyl-CoA transferase